MKKLFTLSLCALALGLYCAFWIKDAPVEDRPQVAREPEALPASPEPVQQETAIAESETIAAPETEITETVTGQFSPEMQRLVDGIYAGQPVRVRVGAATHDYVFRPQSSITEAGFQISTGPDAVYPADFAVFEGRRLLPNGRLVETAKLAVVNDTVSMAYTTAEGDFLIERNEMGRLEAIQLSGTHEGAPVGAWACQEIDGIAGVAEVPGNVPGPVIDDVDITVGGAGSATEPEVGSAHVDHPYFRLGPQYDASLKDISILMVSGSTQTGSSANLSSRAASYFTYTAYAADVYERQLGLRLQLQELILIADDSGQSDVEYNDSVTPNDPGILEDDLNAVTDWAHEHRPQADYGWGHVLAWTLVNADQSWTRGGAWISVYGDANWSVSVNQRRFTWRIFIHELGHSVGANHTDGGVMNGALTYSEDFFTESVVDGGGFTAAEQVHAYLTLTDNWFIYYRAKYIGGPATLRNPVEMPFGADDAVATAVDTPVTFKPLTNDETSRPFGANNQLRLIEVGQVFPKAAGTATFAGDEITFTPSSGYSGNVWFTYTLSGDVGNDGFGWLHAADVVVTVGDTIADPTQEPVISTMDDVITTTFSQDIRLNPLLNDEGKGRLWAGGVDVLSDFTTPGTAESFSGDAFYLVSAEVLVGNGTLSLETMAMGRDGSAGTGNTGYVVYTPGAAETDPVEIVYTVEDAEGNRATGRIYLQRDDADNDGLSDSWEKQYFGGLDQGATDDPDKDNIDNLTEFNNHTDPTTVETEIRLTGTILGTAGSFLNNPAWNKDKVFDGDLSTYYDALNPTGDWAGLDLGSAKQITSIKYAARQGQASRMVGGKFQGSHTADFSSGVVTLYTISNIPTVGILTEKTINDPGAYRYVRYLGPAYGYGNVAEVEFYEDFAPEAPTGLTATSTGSAVNLDWADNADEDLSGYNVYRGTTSQNYGTTLATGVLASAYIDETVVNGETYYYVVKAVDTDANFSAGSEAAVVTFVQNIAAPTGLQATPGDQWITLTWDASTLPEGQTYSVYRRTDAEGYAKPLASDLNDNRFVDRSVTNNTEYFYIVRIVDMNGNHSTSSNEVSAIPVRLNQRPEINLIHPTQNQIGIPSGVGLVLEVSVLDPDDDVFDLAWRVIGGPSTVNWDNQDAPNTALTFNQEGDYVLRLVADDGMAASVQDVYVTVGARPGANDNLTNIGPSVNIGSLAATEALQNVTTQATVSDDGIPNSTLIMEWSQYSGSGVVTFGDHTRVDTTVSADTPGSYRLRLAVDDGQVKTFDSVNWTVTERSDRDENGLLDAWEVANFGNIGIDSSADPDGDGVANFFEYLFGSDPNDGMQRGMGMHFEAGSHAAETDIVATWTVKEGMILGLDYKVHVSTDLVSWIELPTSHYVLNEITQAGKTAVEVEVTHDYGTTFFFQLVKP